MNKVLGADRILSNPRETGRVKVYTRSPCTWFEGTRIGFDQPKAPQHHRAVGYSGGWERLARRKDSRAHERRPKQRPV